MSTKDGFMWTKGSGLVAGIPCVGTIRPLTNIPTSSKAKYDVIVVGAGYAGLTAARNSALTGLKVLLLEARDRIGGRSWSSNIEGYPYEMGGTWVYWGQANVWREIARYGLKDDLEISQDFSRGINKFLLASFAGTQEFTHEESDAILDEGLRKFFNIDGADGRVVVPNPHSNLLTPESRKLDQLSVADRLAEIKDSLTPNERLFVEPFILLISGATLETTSLYEIFHWWALTGYSHEGFVNHVVKYKFRDGQSAFAVRFFNEALSTGNLSYAFDTPVSAITETKEGAQVTTRAGQTFRAAKLISCLPLNVLDTVEFFPPLSEGRRKAAQIKHINQTVKVHAETSNRELRSLASISYPHNKLMYALGDGETPKGNTHIVSFSGQHHHFHPEDDINVTLQAFQGFTPMPVERLVFHNWSRDEYAKGAWFCSPPGLLSNHLKDMRERQGNILFACADWASGWRSFIDGAIEEGTRAATAVWADLNGRAKI